MSGFQAGTGEITISGVIWPRESEVELSSMELLDESASGSWIIEIVRFRIQP